MAVFFNPGHKAYALVSFKALYSRFTAAPTWEQVAIDPTPRLLGKAFLNGGVLRTWFVMRCPYERVISCFMDKYRKQPQRIHADGFSWQHCHQLLYPYLQIKTVYTSEEIANRFLQFTFDDFIDLLPKIYTLDGHFKPQSWTRRLLLGNNRSLTWPLARMVRIEDRDSLDQIPGIDFAEKTNTTGHLQRDFTLEDHHKSVIRALYAKDFLLGGYAH